jgi:hypothetical protein
LKGGLVLGNPVKPAELKLLQGNPGKRKIATDDALVPLEYGYVEPLRELGPVGRQFWDSIFGAGELWISIRTDLQLVQLVCELMDRREFLRDAFKADPVDRKVNMSLLETEKAIISGLSLLGFSPADRTRLGLVSAKTKSKLQELMESKQAKKDGFV